jgi:hypothetical protein
MFIDPREPAGLILAAWLGRWAYRHRSAFVPFAVTGAAFIAAAVIHRHHPDAWIAVMTVTAAVTFVAAIPHRFVWSSPAGRVTLSALARAWEACGIDRAAERAYAAVIIAVSGGWLSARPSSQCQPWPRSRH